VSAPWALVDLLTLRNLAFVLGLCVVLWFVLLFPLLLSTAAAAVLFLWWRRKQRFVDPVAPAGKEVAHG